MANVAASSSKRPAYEEVDWERLDKRKFFVVGAGMFSCVTTVLFPLTVIKTRQMSAEGVAGGFKGTQLMARQIWRQDGVRGYYRGFGTVVFGTMPARVVYLTVLEVMKDATRRAGSSSGLSEPSLSGLSNFVGGAAASAVAQAVVVPVDVVSQRLMVHGMARPGASAAPAAAAAPSSSAAPGSGAAGEAAASRAARAASHATASTSGPAAAPAAAGAQQLRMNGFQMARLILQQEGMRGMYRGFGASLATFVPNSAMWWGAYGTYQKLLWALLPASTIDANIATRQEPEAAVQQAADQMAASPSDQPPALHSTDEVVTVQVVSAMLAGMSTAVITNPLDVVKTRLQVAQRQPCAEAPSFGAVLRELLSKEGHKGLTRGVFPRMANSALWGTAMVSTYEFLKRTCQLPVEAVVTSATP